MWRISISISKSFINNLWYEISACISHQRLQLWNCVFAVRYLQEFPFYDVTAAQYNKTVSEEEQWLMTLIGSSTIIALWRHCSSAPIKHPKAFLCNKLKEEKATSFPVSFIGHILPHLPIFDQSFLWKRCHPSRWHFWSDSHELWWCGAFYWPIFETIWSWNAWIRCSVAFRSRKTLCRWRGRGKRENASYSTERNDTRVR